MGCREAQNSGNPTLAAYMFLSLTTLQRRNVALCMLDAQLTTNSSYMMAYWLLSIERMNKNE